jgi:hypothetical protein
MSSAPRVFTILFILTLEFMAYRYRYDLLRGAQSLSWRSNFQSSDDDTFNEERIRLANLSSPILSISSVIILNRPIGNISRLCSETELPTQEKGSRCLLISKATGGGYYKYKPIPIKVKSWMSPELSESSFGELKAIIYSLQSSSKELISVMGSTSLSGTAPWHVLNNTTAPWHLLDITQSNPSSNTQLNMPFKCANFQPLCIVFHDDEKCMYMYVLAYSCPAKQKWLLFRSTDGVRWAYHTDDKQIFSHLSYPNPTWMSPCTSQHPDQGFHYAIATNHSKHSIGSAVLYRSRSCLGPWEAGPVLGHGLRSPTIHLFNDRHIVVFFTLIGDEPERILLGTIDTAESSDWKHWNLLPGPTLLEPHDVYHTEKNNQSLNDEWQIPSEQRRTKHREIELRHPRFLVDTDAVSHKSKYLRGLLFYNVQRERAVEVAKLNLDMEQYFETVKYRNHQNIALTVLNATSLTKSDRSQKRISTLITGTGRSGTTYLCKLFNRTGLAISHDNMYDCGIYPGEDGAASWYDAFDLNVGRQYDTALQIVRYPLHVINSRVFRMQDPLNVMLMKTTVAHWEDSSNLWKEENSTEEDKFRFALKHWVRRNSFVQRYAEWREAIEDLSSDPMVAWRMCMASYFGPKCPALPVWRDAVKETDPTTNTQGNSPKLMNGSNFTLRSMPSSLSSSLSSQFRWTWEDLSRLGIEESHYVAIAQQMAYEYGYNEIGQKVVDVLSLVNPRISYRCGFQQYDPKPIYWNCWIT